MFKNVACKCCKQGKNETFVHFFLFIPEKNSMNNMMKVRKKTGPDIVPKKYSGNF